jgi:hypothetical protein
MQTDVVIADRSSAVSGSPLAVASGNAAGTLGTPKPRSARIAG